MASKSNSLCLLVFGILLIPALVASSPYDPNIAFGYPLQNPTIVENAASKGAVCLDGSPPAYHLSEGSGPTKDNWMVYLLGGAWCPTISLCLARKNRHLGSSTNWNDTNSIQRFTGILHNNSHHNPDFSNWTKVMVRYCDGSSFTGDVEDVDPTTGLHFRGRRVFDAIVDDLLFSKGMKDAKEVLFTGGSAGGLAVMIHCDRFASHFPTTTRVKCLSDGGFFLHSNNPLQARGLESMFRGTVALHNSTGALPKACVDRMKSSGREEYLCMFPQYIVGDIKTPLLVMATAYDSYQINESLSNSFYQAIKEVKISPTQYKVLQDFRLQFLDVVRKTTDKLSRGGLFINNCFTHTQLTFQGWDNPVFGVNNKTDTQVIGDWYFGRRCHIQEIDANPLVKNCSDKGNAEMSDTDSQDISRDYEGEFPVTTPSGSRTRSTGPQADGSSSRSKVSARAAQDDGDEAESGLREQGPSAEGPSYGRGKSPRRVVEALSSKYQTLSPASRATHLAALPRPVTLPPPRPNPPVLPSSSAPERAVPTSPPRPSVSEPPSSGETKALREAVIKISAESYEYSIFRSPEDYAAADLQAPDYTQKEKYIPEKAGVASMRSHPIPGQDGEGMVLEKSFATAPVGPKRVRKKVALGSLKPASDPPEAARATASTAVPSAAVTVEGSESDLQVSRPLRRRGKEKATDSEVEIVAPVKRPRRPSPPGSTPILDALRDGGEQTSTLLEKIRTMVPDRDHIRSLDTDQVGEHIAQDILRVSPFFARSYCYCRARVAALLTGLSSQLSHMTTDLFCRAKAAENVVMRDVDPLKRSLAEREAENKQLRDRITSLEDKVERTEKEVMETKEKMTNYASPSAFLCRDPTEADSFFRAFLRNKVGEDLTWSYGRWAYTKGQHAMQQEVYAALTESLSDRDLAAVLEIMPDDVADPGPNPFAGPSRSADADVGGAKEAPSGLGRSSPGLRLEGPLTDLARAHMWAEGTAEVAVETDIPEGHSTEVCGATIGD
nr:pectin acetylesterase 8-like [Ipomoea batatas]